MDDVSDLIAPEAVLPAVAAGNKRALFAALAAAAEQVWQVDAAAVSAGLAAREKLGTTGFGAGIAVPHARIAGLTAVRGVFAHLVRPIDFAAVDDLPVDLVFMLVSPPDAGPDHLKALARVSRRLRDRGLAEKLRGARSRDALYAILTGIGARDAA
ncbi:PTS sugar transporter subunit IIA [Sphingomonas sp. RS2018]